MRREPRMIEVRQNVLKRNDVLARELRQEFRDAGVAVVSLVCGLGGIVTIRMETEQWLGWAGWGQMLLGVAYTTLLPAYSMR